MRFNYRRLVPVAVLLLVGVLALAVGRALTGQPTTSHMAHPIARAASTASVAAATATRPAPISTKTPVPQGPQRVIITIDPNVANGQFDPAQIIVPRGSTIIWRNTSDTSHTATAFNNPPANFDTGNIPIGSDSKAIVLTTPGTYQYHCVYHSEMVGTIVVT
jgi:plastocyanin